MGCAHPFDLLMPFLEEDPPRVASKPFSANAIPPPPLPDIPLVKDLPKVPLRIELILDSVPAGIIPSVAWTNTCRCGVSYTEEACTLIRLPFFCHMAAKQCTERRLIGKNRLWTFTRTGLEGSASTYGHGSSCSPVRIPSSGLRWKTSRYLGQLSPKNEVSQSID